MIERLNAETRVHHGHADAELDALFKPTVTSGHYLMFLMRTYGFEAPLEVAFAMTPRLDLAIDPRSRARAGFLAQDMIALNVRPADVTALPLCLAIPQFRGVAEAFGWLYVAERMTLVHNVVRRHLMTRLPIEMDVGSAYLRAYDGKLGKRWQQLGAALDHVAQHPAIADRIVSAAGEAFRCRRQWVAHDGPVLARTA